MFKEHNSIVWGTYCNKCGSECSILQNVHHPWDNTKFTIKLRCKSCNNEVVIDKKFTFINSDIHNICSIFSQSSIDFLVSRDVFMFIEDTNQFFDDVTKIVNKGIRQMGWYVESNNRMKNKLLPEQIAEEYIKKGWVVKLEFLDWYKSGYFINAYRLE